MTCNIRVKANEIDNINGKLGPIRLLTPIRSVSVITRTACTVLYCTVPGKIRLHTITKNHYIPESTFIYQKELTKHMQVCPVDY